jgi:p-aminobenzoyl-glutamate transporter AbgT
MKGFNNDKGISGVVAGVMVFIIIIVGIMSFIMISSAFDTSYKQSIDDPVNSTGMMLNGSGSYESVSGIMSSAGNSAPAGILLALLLAISIVILAVWAILKKGGD